jgi:hypothetical protein
MNWPNVVGLTIGALVLLFVLLRVERKRLWVALLVLVAPTAWLGAAWANHYKRWHEVGVALAMAGVIAGGWWLVYGRKLPPPTSDNIKVWGQENVPRPKPQELQAEVNQLREEKERLEAELRRLKGDGRSTDAATDGERM